MRAAILVPAPDFPEQWSWAYDVEAAVLERGGIEVEPRPWSQPGDLAGFDIVLPLVAWGYHHDQQRWHALLDTLEKHGPVALNPVPLLRWNSDKRYLTELEANGVRTIPTRLVPTLDAVSLDEARHAYGDRIVIKPPVSAAADGTHLLDAGDPIPESALGRPMMVQPFLPSVADEGEYSCLLFGGRFSHAIIKRPKDGDYRVQPHLGGTEVACDPPAGSVELSEAALAAAPAGSCYARVDMVRDLDGELAIIELELIEPSLWLEHAPDGGDSFVAAIRAAYEAKQ